MELADMNRDGKLDIIFSGQYRNSQASEWIPGATIQYGDGNGGFYGEIFYQVAETGYWAQGLVVQDLDNNGHSDVGVSVYNTEDGMQDLLGVFSGPINPMD